MWASIFLPNKSDMHEASFEIWMGSPYNWHARLVGLDIRLRDVDSQSKQLHYGHCLLFVAQKCIHHRCLRVESAINICIPHIKIGLSSYVSNLKRRCLSLRVIVRHWAAFNFEAKNIDGHITVNGQNRWQNWIWWRFYSGEHPLSYSQGGAPSANCRQYYWPSSGLSCFVALGFV